MLWIFVFHVYCSVFFSYVCLQQKNFFTKINFFIQQQLSYIELDMQHEYTFTFKNQRLNQQQSFTIKIRRSFCLLNFAFSSMEKINCCRWKCNQRLNNAFLTFTWNDITLSPHNNNFLFIHMCIKNSIKIDFSFVEWHSSAVFLYIGDLCI